MISKNSEKFKKNQISIPSSSSPLQSDITEFQEHSVSRISTISNQQGLQQAQNNYSELQQNLLRDSKIRIEKICDRDFETKQFTGIPTWKQFEEDIINVYSPQIENISFSKSVQNTKKGISIVRKNSSLRKTKYQPSDLLLLCFYHIYVGESYERMQSLFGIDASWICRIVNTLSVCLAEKLEGHYRAVLWEDKKMGTHQGLKFTF